MSFLVVQSGMVVATAKPSHTKKIEESMNLQFPMDFFILFCKCKINLTNIFKKTFTIFYYSFQNRVIVTTEKKIETHLPYIIIKKY